MNYWLSLAPLQKTNIGPGGLCEILAIPQEHIVQIPRINPVTQTITDAITIKPGTTWLNITLSSRSRIFKEQLQRDAAGVFYTQTIAGNIYSNNNNNHLQLANQVQHLWVLLVRERSSGITYLIGKPKAAAVLNTNYSSQQNTLTEITYTNTSKTKAIIYGPGLPTTGIAQPPQTFLHKMLAEFRIGDANRPPALATKFTAAANSVPEILGKTKLAIFIDGQLKSGLNYSDQLSYTHNTATNEIDWNQQLADSALIQIYEVQE